MAITTDGSAMEQLLVTVQGSPTQTSTNIYDPTQTTKSPFEMELEKEEVTQGMKLYEQMRAKLVALKSQWSDEIMETERRREIRKVNLDVNKLRFDEKIAQDDVLIPIRLADMNITRESVTFVNYFTQSWRSGIFTAEKNPELITEPIEEEFTRVYRYKGWEVPYYQAVDGSRAHGWDSVELCRDTSKPGGFYFRHIGHDRLLFPRSLSDIQSAECLVIVYEMPASKLLEFSKPPFNFDKKQVEIALGDWFASTQPGAPEAVEPMLKVGKCFYRSRDNGYIYTAWYDYQDRCTDWLKAPAPLYIGVDKVEMQPQPPMMSVDPMNGMPIMMQQPAKPVVLPEFETQYPIFLLPYRITEQHEIKQQIGRVFMDEPKQDALTTMWSSMVTGFGRAANIYASVSNPNQQGNGKPEMMDIEISPMGVYSQPINFFSPRYPDPVVLTALQALEQQNAQETNQVAWGVNNRKDSRKTATELDAAQNQQASINSMELVVFSLFEGAMLNAAYRIVNSAAKLDAIYFLGNVQPEEKQQFLEQPYEIEAPGTIDVVKRQQEISQISSLLPQLGGTDLGMVMFADLLTLMFPKKGPQYAAVAQMQMTQSKQGQQLMQAMGAALAGMVKQFGKQIPDAQLGQLTQIMQAATAFTQQPTPATAARK